MQQQAYYLKYLNNEMTLRSQVNGRFGVRAFAKFLNINSGALSQILNAKRIPSLKVAMQLLNRLNTSGDERALFLKSLAEVHKSRGLQRKNSLIKDFLHEKKSDDLSADVFEIIHAWYYSAIMELTFHDNFESREAWIAEQLGIDEALVKGAIADLLELGLLKKVRGRLVKVSRQLVTGKRHQTSFYLKHHQKQVLEKSIESLLHDPLEKRHHGEITMCIDDDQLEEAKKRIRKFATELCNFLENGSRKKVYSLSISLFPLVKRS